MADAITITRPDDWHAHLRDGEAMKSVVGATARQFARAIVMPNLKPPVVDVKKAKAYRDRILAALPKRSAFEPLMTLYLTDATAATEIAKARASGFVKAVKYYPAGATTNSSSGVTDIRKCDAVLEAMQAEGMPLLVHGEVTDPDIDVFDRESVFLERTLAPLVKRFPKLKVVVEHITTHEAAAFVERASEYVAATITAHHLLLNRNAIFAGGLNPHHYCLPVLKREPHRRALLKAATSGSSKFFLGTDSAPHPRAAKESCCGAAGVYTAHAALELYAEAFDGAGALDKLEAFASHNGADFYGLARNAGKVKLERRPWKVPASYAFGDDTVVPLRAGQSVAWRLAG
ncbi:MAG: dihydroorotase [Burkholderiales bacterium]|nr:dihydroorotase [Burkholderiales bacterium]